MTKYKCDLCSYTYDPQKGQPATGVKSNTKWEDVPKEWRCPICGAGKEHFEPVK